MLKRLRTAHPLVFCVLAEVVFLASLFVTDLIFTIVLVLFRADFSALDTYLYSTLQELVGALVAVLFLVRTDRAGLLRRRGSGFFNGSLVGMYPLVFIGYNTFGSLLLGRMRMARCSRQAHLHLSGQHGHGGCGGRVHLPGRHRPDPVGTLLHQPRWCGRPRLLSGVLFARRT